ncbi:MAG TPA: hypothetical protein VKC66_18345 [Xanthobacteraceae bacterium]|nr:hypothetical protein [Xanthobacteraceae bacterium]
MEQYAKAIAAGVMALASVLTLAFHAELPSWLTEEWLLSIFAVLTPILVFLIPNRA